MPTTSLAAERLRGAGLRVTEPRIAVLTTVDTRPHVDAETVHAALGPQHPRLSLQSVHNVLRDLTTHALLRRIEPSDSPALYESRIGDNHHHLVCRVCGGVTDVDCAVGAAPCLTTEEARDHGFVVDEAEVIYWGVCARCAAASPTQPASHE